MVGNIHFRVTESKSIKKSESVGEIVILSDFEKLKKIFNNVNEFFEFLKETKNVVLDFHKPLTIFFQWEEKSDQIALRRKVSEKILRTNRLNAL